MFEQIYLFNKNTHQPFYISFYSLPHTNLPYTSRSHLTSLFENNFQIIIQIIESNYYSDSFNKKSCKTLVKFFLNNIYVTLTWTLPQPLDITL